MPSSILVGDIGSTKSTWWLQEETAHEIQLGGYNPVVHSSTVGSNLFTELQRKTSSTRIDAIWYYGAGILDEQVAANVTALLQGVFPDCPIHVASDLVGAAYAACGHAPGTVAILGTGSHAAIWNGHAVTRQATSLGYILGDDGGGCDIGKSLIQAYFYHDMPDVIQAEMADRIPGGRNKLLQELHSSSVPNQYLATFARVAVQFKDHEWIQKLVSSRFKVFVEKHLVPLEADFEVHIIGSIGCIFASLMIDELKQHRLKAGHLIRNPAQRLFERHMEHGRN